MKLSAVVSVHESAQVARWHRLAVDDVADDRLFRLACQLRGDAAGLLLAVDRRPVKGHAAADRHDEPAACCRAGDDVTGSD